jgi:hypothetical protein
MLFNLDDAGIRNFVHVKPSAIGNVKGEHGAVLYSIGTNSPIEFVYVFVSP